VCCVCVCACMCIVCETCVWSLSLMCEMCGVVCGVAIKRSHGSQKRL